MTSFEIGPPVIVPRPRIENVLSKAIESSPLVILKAPLGTGKSTLLTSVLRPRRVAAIFDAQPWHRETFVDALIAAIRGVRPDFGRRILGTGAASDPTALADLFVTDLLHVREPLIVAIDNAEHFAEDAAFGTFLERLVRSAPAEVRFILCGRALPPLAIASLLLQCGGVSLAPDLLPFTEEELASALGSAGRPTDHQAVAQLALDTGGWAATVSLALRANGTGVTGATRELALRFLDETLVSNLDETTRSFLDRLSVFEKIDPDVLALAPEYGAVSEMIGRLERAGVPFLRDGRHVRTHPLVRELGLQRLKTQRQLARAHALAAHAFSLAGSISAALFHAGESGDPRTIDRFLRAHGESVVRTGNHLAIRNALRHLEARASGDIAAYICALLEKDVAGEQIEGLLDRAGASDDRTIAFAARAARLERAIGRDGEVGPEALADLAERSRELGPAAQAKAAVIEGWFRAVHFEFSAALDAIAPLASSDDDTVAFNAGILYAYLQTARGAAVEALGVLDHLVRRFENDDRVVFQTLSLVWQARLAILLGRVTIAGDAARGALRLIDGLPLHAEHAALYLALAEIATNEGNAGEALRFAELTRASAGKAWYVIDAPRAHAVAELTVARASFLNGDTPSALALSLAIGEKQRHPLSYRATAYAEAAAYAAILDADARSLAEKSTALLKDAAPADAADAVVLDTALSIVEFFDAAVQWRLASSELTTVGPFAQLLQSRRGVITPGHLAVTVRNAGAGTAFDALTREGDRYEIRLFRAYAARGTSVRAGVEEEQRFDLTARETEILELLVEGLSNKEIAQRLTLSPRTVETHVERVLGKLEVGSRSRAIAKALRLRLVALHE